MLKQMYVKIIFAYARLLQPSFPNCGIVYLRHEPNGTASYLVMERVTDTDLIFHPVQRWLKGIADERENLLRENQELKDQILKGREDGKPAKD